MAIMAESKKKSNRMKPIATHGSIRKSGPARYDDGGKLKTKRKKSS